MKYYQFRSKLFVICLLVLLHSLFTFGCSCTLWGSPLIDIIIENQTDQVLTIYLGSDNYLLGNVNAGNQITTKAPLDIGKYEITAKNIYGYTVFSETYTHYTEDKYQLFEVDEKHQGVVKVYKAIIPSLKN
jgi:hypothetical protein